MKSFIVLSAVLVVACAQNRFANDQNQLRVQPDALVRPGDFIPIVRQASAVNPDGSYQYQYETANGIAGEEQGVGGQAVQGAAQWTAPDGTPVSLQYTADENGYHAQGSHVPQTPEHILRALEYIRTHPYNEEEERRRQLARDARDQSLNDQLVRAQQNQFDVSQSQRFVAQPARSALASQAPQQFGPQRRSF